MDKMLCNCGRPAKYEHSKSRYSCNKYVVCPTYEELDETNKRLAEDLLKAIHVANDLCNYREGTELFEEAEKRLEVLANKYENQY